MAYIGIVTALAFEARSIDKSSCFIVRRCGVGGAGIGSAVRDLSTLGCGVIVSWGTAGALAVDLKAGDLFVAEHVLTRNGACIATDKHWRQRFRHAMPDPTILRSGLLVESSRLVAGPVQKHLLRLSTGAGAVDMESGLIGEACEALRTPFVVIRGIVDELNDRLPEALPQYLTADGSVRLACLFRDTVLRPRSWGSLVQLARRYYRAKSVLTGAARVLARCADHSR